MIAARKEAAYRFVDHFGQRRLVHGDHRRSTGQGLQRDQALSFVVRRVDDHIGRPEVQRQLFETHARLDVNGMSDAQAFGLAHERFSHVASPDDDQSGPRMLLEDGRH